MQTISAPIAPRAVVFDVYGTLLSIRKPLRPFRQLLDLLGSQGRITLPEDAATIMTIERTLAGTADALGGGLLDSQLTRLEESLAEKLAGVRPFPEVADTLLQLRARGKRLAVCSNLAEPNAAPVRRLLPEMDAYTFSFEVGAIKPQAKIYAPVCQELRLHPSEVLMVGDTLDADVEGPLAFGMKAIHLVRDGKKSPAIHQVSSLHELLAFPYVCPLP